MNRTYAMPAAIALTLHALLFVGSGKPPIKTDGHPPALPPDEPPPVIVVVDPPTPIAPDDDENAGDKTDVIAPPSIIEPPPIIDPTGSEITQKYEYVKPGTATKLTPFNVGRPGSNVRGEKLFTPDLLDDKPSARFQKSPAYPVAMKNTGVTGTVWVEFIVDENGRVHDVRVVKSTNAGFNDVTLTAVSMWRFEPGKHNGLPVRFRMSLPIVFNLND